MIKSLYISNYILIETLDLDLEPNMTVFTGETGAGKSIVIGALSLLFGQRADTNCIGPHGEETEFSAICIIQTGSEADQWLKDQHITYEGEIEIRRIIHRNGKSKSWIAGKPNTNKTVQQLGECLLQIHGQHDQIKLLRPNRQLAIIDACLDDSEILTQVANTAHKWQQLNQQLSQLEQDGSLSNEQQQLLAYQLEELNQLSLQETEYEQLHQQLETATYAAQLKENMTKAQILLGEQDNNASSLIATTIQTLQNSKGYNFSEIIEMLNEASINIEEVTNQLSEINANTEDDAQRRHSLEQRLNQLYTTARKHKVQPEQLYTHWHHLQQQLTQHDNQSEHRQKLEINIEKKRMHFNELAQKLHQQRQATAQKLADLISRKIHILGLNEARIDIQIHRDENKPPQPLGQDQIAFMVAINQGQELQPLNKTASGGELSRIALAIEVVAKQSHSGTLIFDEVDTGVGGAVAEMIGDLLKQLGKKHQILTITHLPQVAGHADQHLHVSKTNINGITQSTITQLADKQRVQELARMVGGANITENTLAQAREFLK